jgi:hypothetical protein
MLGTWFYPPSTGDPGPGTNAGIKKRFAEAQIAMSFFAQTVQIAPETLDRIRNES